MPNRLSTFRMIDNAEINGSTLSLGAPRKVFQAETVVTPGDGNGRSGGEILIWSHGRFKCAKIVRTQTHLPMVSIIRLFFNHAALAVFAFFFFKFLVFGFSLFARCFFLNF
jgi:hypothetical protein